MRSSRPLLTAVAAACLLAAGCDYWKNLVDEQSVTKVPLTIQVRDAYFTQEAMDSAHCTDDTRGIDFTTDRSGRFSIPDAATGTYALHCSMPRWYYDRTSRFEVGAEGGSVFVDLFRNGGADWYPEEAEKWVRIQNPESRLRFPGKFRLDAFPDTTTGALRYQWEFSSQKRFNQLFGSIHSSKAYLNLDANLANTQEGPDTVTLTIKARPPGIPEYTVGSYALPFEWVRKKAPVCDAWANATVVRVGCEGSKKDESVNVFFSAEDPDGQCDSVVFDSPDSTSSLGYFHIRRKCNEPNNYVKLDLKNPFEMGQINSLYLNNYLTVTFWDNDKVLRDTTILITTKSNSIPKVESRKLSPGNIFFTDEPVSFSIIGSDTAGVIRDLYFDWGNQARSLKNLKAFPAQFIDDTISTRYTAPDTVQVTAWIMDDCNELNSYSSGETLVIRKNSVPVISFLQESPPFTRIGGVYYYQFRLVITDQDVKDQKDRFTQINIEWGDGESEILQADTGEQVNVLKRHHYAKDPEDGKVELKVEVFDDHGGHIERTMMVPAFQASP